MNHPCRGTLLGSDISRRNFELVPWRVSTTFFMDPTGFTLTGSILVRGGDVWSGAVWMIPRCGRTQKTTWGRCIQKFNIDTKYMLTLPPTQPPPPPPRLLNSHLLYGPPSSRWWYKKDWVHKSWRNWAIHECHLITWSTWWQVYLGFVFYQQVLYLCFDVCKFEVCLLLLFEVAIWEDRFGFAHWGTVSLFGSYMIHVCFTLFLHSSWLGGWLRIDLFYVRKLQSYWGGTRRESRVAKGYRVDTTNIEIWPFVY